MPADTPSKTPPAPREPFARRAKAIASIGRLGTAYPAIAVALRMKDPDND